MLTHTDITQYLNELLVGTLFAKKGRAHCSNRTSNHSWLFDRWQFPKRLHLNFVMSKLITSYRQDWVAVNLFASSHEVRQKIGNDDVVSIKDRKSVV